MMSERLRSEQLVENSEPTLDLPEYYPYPYTPENFTDEERKVLLRFFTNVDKPVFAVKNLPQQVVGAMFSRYSRSEKTLRRLFLDEFWSAPEVGIQSVAEHLLEEEELDLTTALKRARKFYQTVLAEFGDESVKQMGGPHIAFEFVSQIAAKAIEDGRIAAAYIEKSTRYVDFGTPVDGHYLFMEEPTIMASEYAQEYLEWNNSLFGAYKRNLQPTVNYLRQRYPIDEQLFANPKVKDQAGNPLTVKFGGLTDEKDIGIAQRAYDRALRAKALDTIRVFLPTTTVTNLGAFFSGQAAENAVNKMMASDHPEVRLIGTLALEELLKVTPDFLLEVETYGPTMRKYLQDTRRQQEAVTQRLSERIEEVEPYDVLLTDWDRDADVHIAAQILYMGNAQHKSKAAIFAWARRVKEQDLKENPKLSYSPILANIILDSVPSRLREGLNRRHKLPRAFEQAFAEVDFYADFGIFRDLQRNRMSSTERQSLSAQEVFVPEEFYYSGMEAVLADYLHHARWTKELNSKLKCSKNSELRKAAEYVTILGNKLRFDIRANIRQWCFFSELRTIPGGHKTYRQVMQKAVIQILDAMPFLGPLFAHVDWRDDYGLGRLRAEIKTQMKLQQT